ncbi:hypothetical protein COT49_01665 [candidate division WWE3 bacterium CG08_land_8_20_14_0_20_40_13]|uniref:Uncharacterized protein n=1 Tax=candidate division WWE3 bacterium CG08_land_8_20_14_0_20_40_13 TaxID=1975084 RepID=A0A2H0XG94_UNCKA|nr:MAG: hypothetical protein COT49_01665 [candidate division WWE3 bacterium CG08_land_8_20_14_0_20_40_13]
MQSLLDLVNIAYAAVPAGTVDVSSWRPENFRGIINIAVSALFIIGGIAFVILFLIGAVRYITSGGDVKAVDAAKKNITAAIVGVVIMAGTYSVVWFLNRALGAPTFGGVVSWDSSGGPAPSSGVQFRGDYALCSADIMTYEPACSGTSSAKCCSGKGTQDCINMRAVKDHAPVRECDTSVSACNLVYPNRGPINWDDWTKWVEESASNRTTADNLCINCNICGK